jgi:hypothetical protein
VFPNEGDGRRGLLKQLQVAHDNMVILHTMATAMGGASYQGPKSLKYWNEYAKLQAEFQKALATGTATAGAEFIPTGMSAELGTMVETEALVQGIFRNFTMPTKVYEWPVQTAHPLVYLPGEGATVTEGTQATRKATFTAQKLAALCVASSEFAEDSIVPALEFIRNDMAVSLARAIDNAILNGDTAGTHEDTNTGAPPDYSTAAGTPLKAWLGLRAWCHDFANTRNAASTSTLALADLRNARKDMGVYGVRPGEVVYILGIAGYIKLLSDASVITMEKFGTEATVRSGVLQSVDGCRIVVSDRVRQDLTTAGVFDNVTTTSTCAYAVHTPSWLISDRRVVTLESERVLTTDQWRFLATVRKDFQTLRATTENPVWLVQNFLTA